MVKTINIQMDDDVFWKLWDIKKRLSDGNKQISWKEYILLKRISNHGESLNEQMITKRNKKS